MFESRSHIFIEMEYVSGGQLQRLYENRLQSVKNSEWYQQQLAYLKAQVEYFDYDKKSSLDNDESFEHKINLKDSLFSDDETAQITKGII